MHPIRVVFLLLPLVILSPGHDVHGAERIMDCPTGPLGPTPELNRKCLETKLSLLDFDRNLDSASETIETSTLVSAWLEAALGLKIVKPIEVRVCNKIPGIEAEDSPTLGAFDEEANRFIITVKSGMTVRRYLQVFAHERVHAWQAENCPSGQVFEDYEGFAQWCAGELLKAVGLEDDFRSLANREDLYGEAYRWIASIEEREGRDGLLRHVRTAR